ncbi:MAG: hypothetical protein M1608_05435 [Candidatus Omnitrophica bacterium]|nr:hypothetical protein [Candidatus Omnitrophota bacterium]
MRRSRKLFVFLFPAWVIATVHLAAQVVINEIMFHPDLSNNGQAIELEDAAGRRIGWVPYSAEGDWAVRREGEAYPGHPDWWRGWEWTTWADGGGESIELMNPALPNQYGQNWAASRTDGGTPGGPNSVASNDIPPDDSRGSSSTGFWEYTDTRLSAGVRFYVSSSNALPDCYL